MPRLQSPRRASAELVLDAGRITDESPYLSIDPAERLGARRTEHLFIIVEPVELAYGIEDTAQEVIEQLRYEIDQRRSQTATAALLGAVEEANTWLYSVNRDRPPEEQLQFGLTCVLARDDELYIAQLPPSQFLISQEGELYAFPGLESQRWPQAPDEDDLTGQPLGLNPDIEPDLYHTRIDQGDLLVLLSSSLAAMVARAPHDIFVESDDAGVMNYVEELAARYQVDDAYAAAISVRQPAAQASTEPSFLRRVGDICTHFLPEETAERFRNRDQRDRREVDLDGQAVHTLEYPDDASAVGAATDVSAELSDGAIAHHRNYFDPYASSLDDSAGDLESDHALWTPEAEDAYFDDDPPATQSEGRGKLTGLLAGAILALSAAVVGVWQLTIHRDRPMGGPRDDGTLGLPRLNRYEDRPRLPDLSGVRARLPRAPVSRLTAVVIVVVVFGLIGGLAYSIHSGRVRDREAKVEQLLQQAVQEREQAGQVSDPTVAQAHLLAAEARVREAKADGLDDKRAEQETAAIASARDKALHIERLANIQVLGGVPAAPEGVTPHIFFGNGQLYVFSDALYRLDSNGTTLVRLLAPGDQVGGSPVGALLGASWADGSPIAFDGNNAYVFDASKASWSRVPLGTFGAAYSGIVASSGFGGNLYFLSPESGQILKFAAGTYNNQPEDWTGGQASSELHNAVDMVIDGHIYVLLKDGSVLDFFMSALEKTTPTAVTPPISNAVALSAQPDRPYVYIADGGNRILRVERSSGKVVQQFLPAQGAPPLDGIRDIAVDDVLSLGYVLTDHGLVQVRLPAPPR